MDLNSIDAAHAAAPQGGNQSGQGTSQADPATRPKAAELVRWALRLARSGHPVFPVHSIDSNGNCACGNRQCRTPGKHPITKNGLKDATTDPEQIAEWWKNRPLANIGMRTDGLVVLDVDPRSGGDESSYRLQLEYGTLPETAEQTTGSGGKHFIFKLPENANGLHSSVPNYAGLDIRSGSRHYIIVAPSWHKDGNPYRWTEPIRPSVEPPEWLMALITKDSGTNGQPGPRMEVPEKITDGERNTMLYRLGCKYRADGNSKDEILAFAAKLNSSRCDPPLKLDEIGSIVENAMKHPPGHSLPAQPAPASNSPSGQNLTDLGNAKRFVRDHGGNVYYVQQLGWLVWDGRRYARDETGEVERLAKATVYKIQAEAAGLVDETARQALIKHGLKSESHSRLRALLELAKSEIEIARTPDQFDLDPMLFNVLNGTFDLKIGKLREHRREDLITKLAPVQYNSETPTPVFDAFLSQILGGKEDLIRFLQRFMGYTLTGLTTEQILAIFWGSGSNGKSTFLELFADLLGDYAARTPTSTLMVRRHEGIPNDIARLQGARFVIATENESQTRLSEALVKQLTGGDRVAARYLHKEFFEFKPQFKLFLGTNNRPDIRGQEHAIWRRIKLVPFTVTIPDEEQDKDLPEKLKAEASGILGWAAQGCLEWQTDGLGEPEEVRSATNEYRSDMDIVGGFLDECCIVKENATVPAQKLYSAYSTWCQKSGEESESKNRFGRILTERRFDRAKVSGYVTYLGIGLINLPEYGGIENDPTRDVSIN